MVVLQYITYGIPQMVLSLRKSFPFHHLKIFSKAISVWGNLSLAFRLGQTLFYKQMIAFLFFSFIIYSH